MSSLLLESHELEYSHGGTSGPCNGCRHPEAWDHRRVIEFLALLGKELDGGSQYKDCGHRADHQDEAPYCC